LAAVLVALFLSPFIALMPHAALAGVVIVTHWDSSSPSSSATF
jgi:MFS superfamily sulfate permease-like transporter